MLHVFSTNRVKLVARTSTTTFKGYLIQLGAPKSSPI